MHTTAARRTPRRSTLVLALVLHLVALWPYTVSGLVAPGWAVLSMLGLWALLGLVTVAVHRRWGAVATVVPPLAVALWFALLTLGEQQLGWTG